MGQTICDTLWMNSGRRKDWQHRKVNSSHSHGSGCTLSTAVAVGLARGKSLVDACEEAVQFVTQIIERSAANNLVNENGPLLHFTWDG